MRHRVTRLFQLLTQYLRRVWLDDDLCFKIGAGAEAKVFVILPRKTIRAAMDAAAIAVDREPPAAFKVGRKCLGNDLPGGSFLKYLELCRRRLANVFGGVFTVRIRRICNLSHKCNDNAFVGRRQEFTRE